MFFYLVSTFFTSMICLMLNVYESFHQTVKYCRIEIIYNRM